MKLWCVLFHFLHFYWLNNYKGVYPTPYEFSLATFHGFLKCYIFLCKVADHVADGATKVFEEWKSPRGRKKFEKIAKKSTKHPWRSNTPVTLATSHKIIRFDGDSPQEGIEPYLMEDWGSFEDMGDVPIGMEDEDESHSDLLTWANVAAINSEQIPKDIQDWTLGVSHQPSNTMM